MTAAPIAFQARHEFGIHSKARWAVSQTAIWKKGENDEQHAMQTVRSRDLHPGKVLLRLLA